MSDFGSWIIFLIVFLAVIYLLKKWRGKIKIRRQIQKEADRLSGRNCNACGGGEWNKWERINITRTFTNSDGVKTGSVGITVQRRNCKRCGIEESKDT